MDGMNWAIQGALRGAGLQALIARVRCDTLLTLPMCL